MNKQSIVNILKSNKKDLEERFGIDQLGLYGSYARETQTPNSDLDLVYVLKEGQKMTFDKINELEDYLIRLFNLEKIELVNLKYMNPLVKFSMEKDVIYV